MNKAVTEILAKYNPIATKSLAIITIFFLKMLDNVSTLFFAWVNPEFLEAEINIFYHLLHPYLPLWAILIVPTIAAVLIVHYTYYKAPNITEFFVLLIPFVVISNTMLGLSGLGHLPLWVGGVFQLVYILGFIAYLVRAEVIGYRMREGSFLQKMKKNAANIGRPTQIWETEDRTQGQQN